MCVADGRAALFTRPGFIAVAAGAAAPLLAGAAGLEVAAAADRVPRAVLPEPRGPLTRGNAAAGR
jgi:hypothetical protein